MDGTYPLPATSQKAGRLKGRPQISSALLLQKFQYFSSLFAITIIVHSFFSFGFQTGAAQELVNDRGNQHRRPERWFSCAIPATRAVHTGGSKGRLVRSLGRRSTLLVRHCKSLLRNCLLRYITIRNFFRNDVLGIGLEGLQIIRNYIGSSLEGY